ncbi:MAG: GWxTD domain-containing protein, partial [Gemmatimonadales bacterium]|nr:GWxTD domain-containing protein [Gemmatimonadales bacterium]
MQLKDVFRLDSITLNPRSRRKDEVLAGVRAAVKTATTVIVLLAAYGSPLRGQSAAERGTIGRWRDSLAGTTDTVALRSLQRSLLRLAKKQTDSGFTLLRAGLVAFRRGELKADPDFSEATTLLRKAAKRWPDWPETWHTLGLAEAARAEWEQADRLTLGSRVGVGTLERAAADHRRALLADPGFVPAALALAHLTLGLRDTALLAPARDALRRAARSTLANPPELFLAWGRLERATGEPDSPAAALERFLAAGGARALGLLELARTQLAAGRPEGEARYYEGAALDDSAAAAEYRADLRPIAADSDLARFDAARGSERAAYLRRFWTDRDQLELRADGERLREHYRRLLAARGSFALTVSRRFYSGSDAYRSGSSELDDRGIIYVRHGEPAERLRPFVFGLMPNETWRYARAEGDLLFHFSAGGDDSSGGDLYDYRLVESVLDLHGAGAAPPDQLLLSRQSLSPVYGRMLNWGPYGAARSRARERNLGRVS